MDLGHEMRLIAPKSVRPYVKNQKNDMADAEAIAEGGLSDQIAGGCHAAAASEA